MYSLVVAKNGPKIHPVETGKSRTSGRPGHLEATSISMQKLADLMARQAGLPVTDATGLDGVFDFTLDWSPASDLKLTPTDGAAMADNPGPYNLGPSNLGPSIFTAMQEQLGLRLESGKGPVEVLVVDRMEKMPAAN
jgi:uncharacterized protein (TIGR03435 family)